MTIALSGTRPKLDQTNPLNLTVLAGDITYDADSIFIPVLIQNFKPDSLPDDVAITVDYVIGGTTLTATSGDFSDNKAGDALTTTPDFTNGSLSIATKTSNTIVELNEAITASVVSADISTTYTDGSATLTLADTTGLVAGDTIASGEAISGTIALVNDGTTVTLSAPVALSPNTLAASIDTTSGSPIITDLASTFITSGVVAGDTFTSANFTGTVTVVSVDSETQLTVDINADSTASGEAITINFTGARTDTITYDYDGTRSSAIVVEVTGFDSKVYILEMQHRLTASSLVTKPLVHFFDGTSNADANSDGVDDSVIGDAEKIITLPQQTFNLDAYYTNAGVARA